MRRIFDFVDRLTDRIGYWHGTYILLASSSIMGVISGWLSTSVEWISQFGVFGWWVAALLGALVTALFCLAIATVRYAWIHASSRREWAERVDDFNPLDKDFKNKRIKIQDLMHPISKRISGKRFYDCELIGPANVFLHKDIDLFKNGFFECSFVVLWPDADGRLGTTNAVILDNIEFHGGAIWGATILVPPSLVGDLKESGANFVTLTGDQELDNRWQPSSE